MSKWLAAVCLVLFLSGSAFSAEPFHVNYSLTNCKSYDEKDGAREVSNEGSKIIVKSKNMSWSDTSTMPKETRNLNEWEVGVTVVDCNGAYFGLEIGNADVSIGFDINTAGEYSITAQHIGSQSKVVKWGNSQSIHLPARLVAKYNLVTSRFVGKINDLEVVSIEAANFPSLPRFVTVTEVGISTRTMWCDSHKWALYKDFTVDASR